MRAIDVSSNSSAIGATERAIPRLDMRQLAVRLQLLLAAVIVLLAAAASDRAYYLCKMTGRAVAECCCAQPPPSRASRSRVTARAADCCELLAASQRPVATSHQANLPDVPLAAVATAPAFAFPEPSSRLVPIRRSLPRTAPAAIGPPIFLSHCALLI